MEDGSQNTGLQAFEWTSGFPAVSERLASVLGTDSTLDHLPRDFDGTKSSCCWHALETRTDLEDSICFGNNNTDDCYMLCDCGAVAPPLPMDDDFSFVEDFCNDQVSPDVMTMQQKCMQWSPELDGPRDPLVSKTVPSSDAAADISLPTTPSTSHAKSITVSEHAVAEASSDADNADIFNDPKAAHLFLQSIRDVNQLMECGRRVNLNGLPIERFGGHDFDLRLSETFQCREKSPVMGLLLDACLSYVPNKRKTPSLSNTWNHCSNPRLNCMANGFQGDLIRFVNDPNPRRRIQSYRKVCKQSKPCEICIQYGSSSEQGSRTRPQHIARTFTTTLLLDQFAAQHRGDIHNDPVAFKLFLHSLNTYDKLLAGALFANPSHKTGFRLGGEVYNLNSAATYRRARKESPILGLFLDANVVVRPNTLQSSCLRTTMNRNSSPRLRCLSHGFQGHVTRFLSDADKRGEIYRYDKLCSLSKPCQKCESPILESRKNFSELDGGQRLRTAQRRRFL